MSWQRLKSGTILFIGILFFVFLLAMIFGSENIMLGVTLVTGFLCLKEVSLCVAPLTGSIIIFLLFPIVVFMVGFTQGMVWLGLIINILTLLIVMMLTSVEHTYKAYIPFILTFIFLQNIPASGQAEVLRMIEAFVGGLVVAITYYIKHINRDEPIRKTIPEIVHDFFHLSEHTLFIIRMAIGISIGIVIGQLMHQPKTLWITIVVMAVTQMSEEAMYFKFKSRLFGFIIGSIVFVILFVYLIPEQYTAIAAIVIGFIYSFIEEYRYKQIFTTISALSAAMTIFGSEGSIINRILMLIVGGAIVFILYWLQKLLMCYVKQDR